MQTIMIDGSIYATPREMHLALKKMLSLPEYYGLNADGSGMFPWEDGRILPSSVKYVHQKDAHLHRAVMETLDFPEIPFGEE